MNSKKKTNTFQSDPFVEQLKSIPNPTSKSFKKDLINHGTRVMQNQVIGGESLEAGESYEKPVSTEQVERRELPKQAAYEVRQEIILFTSQEQETQRQIEALQTELIALIRVVKEVDFEIQKNVMQIPVNPGVYHLNFLDRVRNLLKLVREKLEDSRTWLKLANNKRKQKGYWSMYKKKGTSFGLSGERAVSTQTG